jgi:cytochrome c oxidase subunit 1
MADGGHTYDYTSGVMGLNKMMSYSAWLLAVAQIPFLINFFWSFRKGEKVDRNPWRATTLEWQAPSPPPHGNFDTALVVYRDPYDYSQPGAKEDFTPQNQPAEA